MSTELERLLHDGALFRLLVDSVRDYAIFAMDPSGSIASWNAGAQHIKGYTADEAIGMGFSAFYTAEDRAAGVPQAILRAAREHGSVATEGWRVRKDGSRFWANVLVTALHNPSGGLVGFAKITRDLTERRAREEELRRRERQLAEAQELTGLGGWEWDVNADRVSWTDELYRIYGLDPDSSPATFDNYLMRVHPADRERVRSAIERALGTGADFSFEERIVRPDGTERVLQSTGRAVRGEDGGVSLLSGACLDVTELRRAEKRATDLAREQAARETAESMTLRMSVLLRASEALAQALDLDATLDAIGGLVVPDVVDWSALDLVVDEGSIRRVAAAHVDPAKRRLALSYLERFPPDPDGGALWEVIRTGEPRVFGDFSRERMMEILDDAEQVDALVELGLGVAVVVPLSGRTGVLGTLTLAQAESGRTLHDADIWLARELGRHAALAIENARLHRELAQRSAEAEEANQAKSAFLAAISHELRTPLNAIVGYADLLELGVHGPINEAQGVALDRIKRNQRSLLALINDVLNFARLEAGKLEFMAEDVPVADLVAEMGSMVALQVEANELHFRAHMDREDLIVHGDRERIGQVLLNLLTNAIKFTSEGGTVELGASAEGDWIRLLVRDTGGGIPADQLEAIFDPFVQVGRRPGAPASRGVGLGLAISRDLAEGMGGSLTVESTLGGGSTFALRLPRTQVPDGS